MWGLSQLHEDFTCPGFASDCVETLEEIAIEGKKSFKENGGRDFHMIECLNDSPQHIQMLKKLVDPYIQ